MDKAETNGYLRSVEWQLLSLESAMQELSRSGTFNDPSYATFLILRSDLTNLTQKFSEIRHWNLPD